ncbi:hypothetical protein DNTS_014966 [Danionella cerebrum]|uniref:Anaphylatoxin-like domain-containing protein n=1 Tax=Danionella cerebrum TaxID=2873325 RepID=A0A553R6N4_9TELE|nr:hypothetical protein DNTS_014966 [Danionella translucida]
MLLSLLLWGMLLCQLCDGEASHDKLRRRTKWSHRVPRLEPVKGLSPSFSILAPSKIRLGTKQNILLEGHSLSRATKVTLVIYDYPASQTVLHENSVTLSPDNNYSVLKAIEIDPERLLPDGKKKYVKLVAEFIGYHQAENVIPVSFRSGHIFIQTDKPIYNPGDAVRFRAFVSDMDFRASERTLSVEIQNPDGIAIHRIERVKAIDGVLPDIFTLSAGVKEGKWKVVAKFEHGKENVFSREFEVKKYVLPAFNVTLTPSTPHVSLDQEALEVKITARYLYEEPVQGVAYVMFGIEINGEKKRLTTMKQINDLNGGSVSLSVMEIKRAYPDTNSLLGASVYVKASVLTTTGSDLVEAEKSGIKIVKSPYVLSFKNTQRYFKPGLPLGITIIVSKHDGSPAPNVPIKVNLLDNIIALHNGIINAHINFPENHGSGSATATKKLKVETMDPSLKPEQQATEEVNLEPYATFSSSSNYLHISAVANRVMVGNSINIIAHIKSHSPTQRNLVEQLTYAVLNKGKIIRTERVSVKDKEITNIPLHVTSEMLPAFRIVAYYILSWEHKAEVVSDSLYVDVEDRCVGSLSIGTDTRSSLSPGSMFKLQVKGDPGAKVSLVAVDNAVFLLSKSRLTQKKASSYVWEVVDQTDLGCSAGGGSDFLGVFSDAGLMFHSSTGGSTVSSKDCSSRSRRQRRSAAKHNLRVQLEKVYRDELQQRCCVDGMREIPMPYSCSRRLLYITEGWRCMQAFLRCCSEYRGEDPGVFTRPPPTMPPEDIQPILHYSRILFEENIKLYSMPVALGESGFSGRMEAPLVTVEEEEEIDESEYYDDTDGIEEINVRKNFQESWLWTDVRLPLEAKSDRLAVFEENKVLPDSITQWGFFAISSSPQTGFCVAEPYYVQSSKPFFIDLRLPHSVSRNEHVEIKAVVHNNKNETLKVMVILEKTQDMCSVAFTGQHKQQITVEKFSSKLVSYTIIPLTTGELPLQVIAIAAGFKGEDAVRKNLRVVYEGVQTVQVRSFVLDPSAKGGRDGKQYIVVDKVELESVVPNSEPETVVNIRGNLMADSIDNSINDDSLASLIRMPGGCVEQNLARMTFPLITTHYLDRSGDWDTVGIDRREEAIKYIQKGYENQLNYRKSDDSYPPYAKEGSSTWITAFVLKVFSMARPFIAISDERLCGPLLYLLKNKQRSDGSFQEDNPVYDTSMTGGMQGPESRMSLTAFVLIALTEAQSTSSCTNHEVNIQEKTRLAAGYLQEHFSRLSRPYTAAIACYALALSSNSCNKDMLLKHAQLDRLHWEDKDNFFFSLEATGYALLALVKGGHMNEAAMAFQWLNEHRGIGGSYGSTQSTMVVLQALAEYQVKIQTPSDHNLEVELSVSGRSDLRWVFQPKVAYVARSSRVPLDFQRFAVAAAGNGKGILEVVTVYHQLPDVFENRTCKGFQLDVSIAQTNEKLSPDVEKSYRLNINVRALEESQLQNSVDRYISHFKVVDNLSDRASLIIHLFRVSNSQTDMISFRLNQKFKVSLLQPSMVTVYQYYNKDKRCSRFYSPPEDKKQLDQICHDDVCRCSHVKLHSISRSHYDQYEMEIVQIIKEGTEEHLSEQERRMFLAHASCRSELGLKEGQEYLLIGPVSDTWNTGSSSNKHAYTLGKNTWVERWPSKSECGTTPLQHKCQELKEFTEKLSQQGCLV